jgi:ligand-binding SRPBCC domain-containing protein
MEHLLETTIELPLPCEEAFEFFADAANLERITPPELHFRFVTPLPVDMRVGALIEYRLRLLGVPFGWTTCISVWDPPRRFVDEQLRGPYALWEHSHSFTETGAGARPRTRIADRVRYRLPLSPLGDVAHALVRRRLERIFAFREEAVREALLDAPTVPRSRPAAPVPPPPAARS